MKEFATITVIGKDKTGVVARITNYLFEQHANIEALEEQVTRGQFSMTIQASWSPQCPSRDGLRDGLAGCARSLGMEIRARFTEPNRRQRMALMVTRETHCAEAVIAGVQSGAIKADAPLMVGNWEDLRPLAEKAGIAYACVPWESRPEAEARVLQLFEQHEIDFVVLARFMKILSPNFVWRFKNKIINIHPSLLPSFPGPQPYRQAYELGVKVFGVTAHFVSMHLDEGPIIAQASAPVPAHASLKTIVASGQKLEAKVLVKAVKLYLSKRLDVYWGVVKEV